MWSYYGSKETLVKYYPKPRYGKIIEPFAGSARYSLRYFENDVVLVDKYDVIIKIWKWLQQCSEADILGLPRVKEGENINDFKFDCDEARLLMGFCIGFGSPTPRHLASPRARHRPNSQNYTLKRIAASLFKIRHWDIRHGSYEDLENVEATWFIDPPYQHGGKYYKHGIKGLDFSQLSAWCMSRLGQIIVCENSDADWMDFKPILTQQVLSGRVHESIWTNQRISPMGQQQTILL